MWWRDKRKAKRGHCQQNLALEITASVTICQVRNKDCELNGLRGYVVGITDRSDLHKESPRRKIDVWGTRPSAVLSSLGANGWKRLAALTIFVGTVAERCDAVALGSIQNPLHFIFN